MKPNCYGTIFPPVAEVRTNRDVRGKVFGYYLVSRGLGVQDRKVNADASQWDGCLACPEFDGCFALSLGKLALEQAVGAR